MSLGMILFYLFIGLYGAYVGYFVVKGLIRCMGIAYIKTYAHKYLTYEEKVNLFDEDEWKEVRKWCKSLDLVDEIFNPATEYLGEILTSIEEELEAGDLDENEAKDYIDSQIEVHEQYKESGKKVIGNEDPSVNDWNGLFDSLGIKYDSELEKPVSPSKEYNRKLDDYRLNLELGRVKRGQDPTLIHSKRSKLDKGVNKNKNFYLVFSDFNKDLIKNQWEGPVKRLDVKRW
jgi:hypothetical protein